MVIRVRPLERRERPQSVLRVPFAVPTSRPAKRRLEVGTIHVYPLTVRSGRFLELVADQDGVDLQVSVLDTAGRTLFVVDSPNGSNGPERVLFAPQESTSYRLAISARMEGGAGRYWIRVAAEHPSSERERMEAAAEELFHQASEAMRSGDLHSPEPKLLEASHLWGRTHDFRRQADALGSLGNLYANRWEWQRSLQVRLRAKSAFHRLGRFGDEGSLANDIGLVYEEGSDLKRAHNSYQEALALGKRSRNRYVSAAATYNLGALAQRQSRTAEALENLEKAQAIWRDLRKPEEIKAATKIGMVFAEAGKIDLAFARFRESLTLADRKKDMRQKAAALLQMGNTIRLLDPDQAQRLYGQALEIQQRQGYLDGLAATLNGIGLLLLNQKKYQEAFEPFQKALRIYKHKGNPLDEARILTNLGWTYVGLRRDGDAREAFYGALVRARGRDGWTEAGAHLGLAQLERQRGNPIAAQSQSEAAVRSVENLRDAVSHDFRTSFFATGQDIYDTLIEILLWRHELQPSAGYDERALVVSEQARSRGLLDDVSEFRQVGDGALALPTRILSLSGIRRAILDPETLLLEFHLGKEASHLWLVSQTSCRVFKLPPRPELASLADKAHRSLIATAHREKLGEARRAVLELSRALLNPTAPWLGRKRLLISAPEILQQIPFAVLPDPATVAESYRGQSVWPQPLVSRHEIVKIPSASVVAVLHARETNRIPPSKVLAIVADPVFDASDGRLSGAVGPSSKGRPGAALYSLFGHFKRLAHAREEAEAILVETGRRGVLAAFDFDASRELALSGKLRNFRNLHFTTHGVLQAHNADLSAIVLSQVDRHGRLQDGFLRAADVSNLNLPADLVVLSACETGLGERIPGEGLVGLPQAFMAAGATRVLVSLWPVDDLASSELMKRFYHEYIALGRSPAAALREAQRAMSETLRHGAPFYWGAFELQGDWRPAESPR